MDKEIQDPGKRMIELLFKQNRYQETGNMLRIMWNERKKILKLSEGNKKEKVTRKNTKKRGNTQPVPVKK